VPEARLDDESGVVIVPANEARWEDLEAVLGARGFHGCWCQRFKLRGMEWDTDAVPAEERAHRLRVQTACGHAASETTSGLVAYLDGEPVGWCAVEPRTAYVRLGSTPWRGRAEDKTDASVWAVTCLATRTGFRRRGISRALVRAAVDFAREHGARALEGYPMVTVGQSFILEELHVGSRGSFADAGFAEVSRPILRRVVMRIDF